MDDKTKSAEGKDKPDKKGKSDNKVRPDNKEKPDEKANAEDPVKSVDGQASDNSAKTAGAPGDDDEKPPAEAAAAAAATAAGPPVDAPPASGANAVNAKAAASVFSDAVYTCDRQYAIVLAQLMTNSERERVYAWVERLDKMKDNDKVRDERDKYLKFLILSLSNRKLVPPFTKVPPPGLREVLTVVPKSVHSLIFTDKGEDPPLPKPKEIVEITYSQPDQVEPRMFFSRQPVPRNGGIVYAAAFSMQKP